MKQNRLAEDRLEKSVGVRGVGLRTGRLNEDLIEKLLLQSSIAAYRRLTGIGR